MTKLLNFATRPGGTAAMYVGPEDIVREAENLGQLRIENDWGSSAYKAEIRFKNRNGSLVWAAGIDTDFFTAIAKSIQEAQRLK